MKVSYQWLKEHLEFDLPVEKVGELLTDSGLEVEGIEKFESIPGGLHGVVVGEVLETSQHPNADRLKNTKVSIGESEPLPIVCGAPNVEAGQKVAVATVGTTLYTQDGESFVIKKSKIRGEVSEGMICAEDELGLGSSHDGIMVLDPKAKVGQPLAELYDIQEDFTIEIGLTPNRADGMSHLGIARDLLAMMKSNGLADRSQSLSERPISGFKEGNGPAKIDVEVHNSEACPRYAGVEIEGVEVRESPSWLQNRLKSIGLSPINNVVDATNFVLHDLGQPLHAFDLEQIEGGKINVATADPGAKFITLDEKERELDDQDLMINNGVEGMCIAGVFGGIKSGVTEKTKGIFLESAYFDPVFIRKTAKRHGLNTDASFRFERGIDPNMTITALKRAALLITEIAGGNVASKVTDIYSDPIKDKEVSVRYAYLDKIIGKKIDRQEIVDILSSLDITVVTDNADGLSLDVPAYRVDVERPADIAEEILRIYGYNNVELPHKLTSALNTAPLVDKDSLYDEVAGFLVGNGFSEIMANSLTKGQWYDRNEDWKEEKRIELKNPLSSDLNVLRQNLLFGTLDVIHRNQNHRHDDLKLFELGQTYNKSGESFEEQFELCLAITGSRDAENWNSPGRPSDFYALKSVCDRIFEKLGIDLGNLKLQKSNNGYLVDGLEYRSGSKFVLVIGEVAPKLLKQFDVKGAVYFAKILWDAIPELLDHGHVSFHDLPKFQEVRRDLALLLDDGVEFEAIEKIAKKTDQKFLRRVGLFDVYEGKNLPKGKKSYALSFHFYDDKQTLVDEKVDKSIKRIYDALATELNAELRSGELQ